jgi:FeS assembly SUF system protein
MEDPEYEKLKTRRILPTVNQVRPTDAFMLKDAAHNPAEGVEPGLIHEDVIAILKTVYDPEIPLNIYDLGLIYEIAVDSDGRVHTKMTLTAPGCPVAGSLVSEVHEKVRLVHGVSHATTELVWEPPWTKDNMSEAAKLELGLL